MTRAPAEFLGHRVVVVSPIPHFQSECHPSRLSQVIPSNLNPKSQVVRYSMAILFTFHGPPALLLQRSPTALLTTRFLAAITMARSFNLTPCYISLCPTAGQLYISLYAQLIVISYPRNHFISVIKEYFVEPLYIHRTDIK